MAYIVVVKEQDNRKKSSALFSFLVHHNCQRIIRQRQCHTCSELENLEDFS